MRHTWSEKDDQSLKEAIERCEPLLDHYTDKSTKTQWWDTVAGALRAMGLDATVTGKACQARWGRIREIEVEANEEYLRKVEDKAWRDVAHRVDLYEMELAEATHDQVNHLTGVVNEIHRALSVICKELGVDLKQKD